jgi:ATP-binding cassette subfamily G (WHITE) protein 2 (PDR)
MLIAQIFDKVTILYSGHQVYFGPASEAKQFFTNMGFEAAPRQTTADFLTSLTNPAERRVRTGFEAKVPRTPQEFVKFWKSSDDYRRLKGAIEEFDIHHLIGSGAVGEFKAARRMMQARSQ